MDLRGLGDWEILANYDMELLNDECNILVDNGKFTPNYTTEHPYCYEVELSAQVMQRGYPNAWGAQILVKSSWNIHLLSSRTI